MVGILIIVYVLLVSVLCDCVVYVYCGQFEWLGVIDVLFDVELVVVLVQVCDKFVEFVEVNGVLVLIDIFGVMFVNIVLCFVDLGCVCVLVGVNLLMFVCVICYCFEKFE